MLTCFADFSPSYNDESKDIYVDDGSGTMVPENVYYASTDSNLLPKVQGDALKRRVEKPSVTEYEKKGDYNRQFWFINDQGGVSFQNGVNNNWSLRDKELCLPSRTEAALKQLKGSDFTDQDKYDLLCAWGYKQSAVKGGDRKAEASCRGEDLDVNASSTKFEIYDTISKNTVLRYNMKLLNGRPYLSDSARSYARGYIYWARYNGTVGCDRKTRSSGVNYNGGEYEVAQYNKADEKMDKWSVGQIKGSENWCKAPPAEILWDSKQANDFLAAIKLSANQARIANLNNQCESYFPDKRPLPKKPTSSISDMSSLTGACKEGVKLRSLTPREYYSDSGEWRCSNVYTSTQTLLASDNKPYTLEQACEWGREGAGSASCGDGETMDSSGSCVPDNPINTSEPDPEEPTCESAGGSLGWIMCPIIETMQLGINAIMDMIDSQLAYKSLNERGDYIKNVWGGFVSLANIAFAIVFLIVIYSAAIRGGGSGGKS
jgi:hypothetical protein